MPLPYVTGLFGIVGFPISQCWCWCWEYTSRTYVHCSTYTCSQPLFKYSNASQKLFKYCAVRYYRSTGEVIYIDMSFEDAVAVRKCKLETIEAGGPLESIPSAEPHASSRKLLNHNHSSLLSKTTNARFSLFFPTSRWYWTHWTWYIEALRIQTIQPPCNLVWPWHSPTTPRASTASHPYPLIH